MSGRVAVMGDVGGQLVALRAELERLGADPVTGRLPDDLTVIQVGDLVHRGPDSPGVVALVDHYLDTQPMQWVQLVGNHEAQYLRPAAFDWPEHLDDYSVALLKAWWGSGKMRPAAAILTVEGNYLVTHAGLTSGYWRRALDAPTSVVDATVGINSLVGLHEDVLFYAGAMLGGGDPDFSAGPLWASEGEELLPSWLAAPHELPFGQVHGHSSVADWRRKRLVCPPAVAAVVQMDHATAQTTARIGAHRIIGVDPKHGKREHKPWQSLVLERAIIAT